jgi:hypothetical protein
LNLAGDEIESDDGDLHAALDYARQAETISRRIRHPHVAVYAQGLIGHALMLLGDREQAWYYLRDTLGRAYRLGATRLVAGCLVRFATMDCSEAPAIAAEFIGHSDALLAEGGLAYEKMFLALRDEVEMTCRAALESNDYDASYRRGATATTPVIIETVDELALSESRRLS